MKLKFALSFLAILAVTLVLAKAASLLAALLFAVFASAIALNIVNDGTPFPTRRSHRAARECGATLTATEIITDTMDAFKSLLPMLNAFSTRYTPQRVTLGQSIIGHIRSLPVASTYDAGQGGYKNGATSTAGLLTDIPVTVDQHIHVPIKMTHLLQIAAQKNIYQDNIRDCAYVLARAVLHYVLGKFNSDNFSQSTIEAVSDSDRSTLGQIKKTMNKLNGGQVPRIGIVNSDVFETLDTDTRIASRDFYGQMTGGMPLGHLSNVAGFSDIWEYPDLPSNNQDITGIFCDPRAVAVVTGLPDHNFDLARTLGLPSVMKDIVVTDEGSGLSMLGLMWQEQGTADIYLTVTMLFGASAGKQLQGNAAGVATDYAGHLLKSE